MSFKKNGESPQALPSVDFSKPLDWHSIGESVATIDIAVEDPDLGPTWLAFFDEFQVIGSDLIEVMGRFVLEADMEGDMEILVVHFTAKLAYQGSCGVINHTGVFGKVLVAESYQLFNVGWCGFLEGEKDIMKEVLAHRNISCF